MLCPPPNHRKKILAVLARQHGFSLNATAEHLGISRNSARKYNADFDAGGVDALLERKKRPRKADSSEFKRALFGLLHEPPHLSGYNRTTWRIADLRETLAKKGHAASAQVVQEAIKASGFR
jgi:transposase